MSRCVEMPRCVEHVRTNQICKFICKCRGLTCAVCVCTYAESQVKVVMHDRHVYEFVYAYMQRYAYMQ